MKDEQFNLLDSHIGYGASKPKVIIMGLEEGVAGIVSDKEEDTDEQKQSNRIQNESTILANYNQRIHILSKSPSNLLDLREYHVHHPSHEERSWFQGDGKSQKTWQWYCKLLVGLNNNGVWENENLLQYQVKNLGRKNSDHCLLEFYPLPRPKNGDWYDCMKIQSMGITDKNSYLKSMVTDKRRSLLNNIIKKGQVRLIVIHGSLSRNQLKSSHNKIAVQLELEKLKEHVLGKKENGKNIYALEYGFKDNIEKIKIFFIPFLGNGAITNESLKKLITIIND